MRATKRGKRNVYCTPKLTHFATFKAVYDRYFAADNPARIFMQVPSWPGPFDVEINCVVGLKLAVEYHFGTPGAEPPQSARMLWNLKSKVAIRQREENNSGPVNHPEHLASLIHCSASATRLASPISSQRSRARRRDSHSCVFWPLR